MLFLVVLHLLIGVCFVLSCTSWISVIMLWECIYSSVLHVLEVFAESVWLLQITGLVSFFMHVVLSCLVCLFSTSGILQALKSRKASWLYCRLLLWFPSKF